MSVLSALRKLRLRRISQQDLEEIYRQIDDEKNDRGAAILAALTVDAALENAIAKRLTNCSSIFHEIFDNGGPLSIFNSKTLIAQAVGIIQIKTRTNLNTIKHIRNTFAHAGTPITFKTKEIEEAVESLEIPSNPRRFFQKDLILFTTRQRFTGICEATAVNLVLYAAGCGPVRADLMRPDAMIPVTPAPLP